MKKIFLIFTILLLITGCQEKSATSSLNNYLNMYKYLDDQVVEELDKSVAELDLTETQKEDYKEAVKKEYQSLNYEIINERYENNVAFIKTKINVLNLYDAQKKAFAYLEEHKEEFLNEYGIHDDEKFLSYKINQMNNTQNTIDYEIEFKLIKEQNDWKVSQLSSSDLEKIHGIYNYDD